MQSAMEGQRTAAAGREAVERAREEWRQTLAQESRDSVERALAAARQQWQAR